MNKERLFNILKTKQIHDIYYNDEPIWIQEINDDIVKIGFLNGQPEEDVYIEDLYEKEVYSENSSVLN